MKVCCDDVIGYKHSKLHLFVDFVEGSKAMLALQILFEQKHCLMFHKHMKGLKMNVCCDDVIGGDHSREWGI